MPASLLDTVTPGITVALIAGITLFLLNWLRGGLTAKWKKKSEAEVLAFSLVTEFDRLIAACAEVVDDPLHMDQQTGIWESTVKTPWIEWPDNWHWSSFPKRLQYRVRSIPNKIYLANRSASALWDHGDVPPDYVCSKNEKIGTLGSAVKLLQGPALLAPLSGLCLQPGRRFVGKGIKLAWSFRYRERRLDCTCVQILCDRVARQPGASTDLTDRLLLSQRHPADDV